MNALYEWGIPSLALLVWAVLIFTPVPAIIRLFRRKAEQEGGVKEFEPLIRCHTFGEFSINITVVLRAREYVNRYLITHEFIKHLHKRCQQEGIEIPFPIRTVHRLFPRVLETKEEPPETGEERRRGDWPWKASHD